jgi:uncharacterized protein
MSTDSKSNALWHLADALSEDILNTPADDLVAEVAADHGNPRALAADFDRIFRRGLRRVRRQEYIDRLKQLINLPWPTSRFAIISIGALTVIVIASALCDRPFRSADKQPTNLASPAAGATEPIVVARAPKGLNRSGSSAPSLPDLLASGPDVNQAKQSLRVVGAGKPPQSVLDRQMPTASVATPRARSNSALAFDGTTAPSTAALSPGARTAALSPGEALRGNAHAPEATPGKSSSLTALQYAAEQGQPVAQWKLGRMYADGDGVPRDDLRAFNYFSQIANSHPDEAPGTPRARFVANAFVALGHYYLIGIPNSKIVADRARARDMFGHAATYFGDADAQYELGQLYLTGAPADAHQAARWFQLAATKGHCLAEVALGDLLFQGQAVPRQAARGLMWLTLGRDCAGPDETWVKPVYDSAFKRASDDERALALVYLEDWLKGRRD